MEITKEAMKEYAEYVHALNAEGKSKAQVQDILGTLLIEEHGIANASKILAQIPKIIKDAGVKFRKGKGSTWKDVCAQAFREDPNLSKEDMKVLVDEAGMKDPDWYVNAWHHVFATIAGA